ncbi:MAG: HU family DNA-binding protein [Planctomycetota bacterium]|nr:HU family DNA-binding protein [Planctomycetota bacterium]MDE1889098.1 HU family DNA-binding protein [Planctomycetota bacterium]MDE2216355.1 HU family DNA-binding protein [Planctomycetota bacterium]
MNKQELVEAVAKECEVSKACGEKAVNAVLDGIKNGVKKSKEVRLVGFGSFSVKARKARKGRNPQTGETINIKASKTVKFSAGQDFKNMVNK